MKNHWIILSAVVITVIAYFDVRDRFSELNAIAADTNAQVEMMDNAPKSSGQGVQHKMNTIQQKQHLDDKSIKQKAREEVNKITPMSNPKNANPLDLNKPINPSLELN